MIPILFEWGPLRIGSYGLMMGLAFLICGWLLRREFQRAGLPGQWSWSLIFAAAVGGIAGARLYFIIEHLTDFWRQPLEVLFSTGGLTWYGGFVGGGLVVIWQLRRLPADAFRLADLIAPLLLLGYSIGRIGCFLAGDGDYGPPSDLPWAMVFPHGIVPTSVPVHPTPLYETLLAGLFFALLWRYRRRVKFNGVILSAMLVLYGIERFTAEFWRTTPRVLFHFFSTAQLLSLVTIAAGVGLYVWRRNSAMQISAE